MHLVVFSHMLRGTTIVNIESFYYSSSTAVVGGWTTFLLEY